MPDGKCWPGQIYLAEVSPQELGDVVLDNTDFAGSRIRD
jgi:hypothetical protein